MKKILTVSSRAGEGADAERVAFFADQLLVAAQMRPVTAAGLCWFAEPSDYLVAVEIRALVNPRLDRVLVHVTGDLIAISSTSGTPAATT